MSGPGPENWPFSPAAERVLEAARNAGGNGSNCAVTGMDILLALWRDESRAAEVLKAAGFDPNSAPGALDGSNQEDVLPAVMRGARRRAIGAGEGEIGTEHLLAALLETDPSLRDLAAGLDFDGLTAREEPGPVLEPLDFHEEPEASSVEEPGVGGAGGRIQSSATSLISHCSPLAAQPDRILDAAANRAREGLRVVEDYIRFQFDDACLSESLKTLRHDLADALSQLGGDSWHRMRDTPGDVGTTVTTEQESARASLRDVLRANCKRVGESLRSLEEFGKLIDGAAAGAIEQIRYRFYSIEQAVLTTDSSRARLAACRLYLLVGEAECPRGLEQTVREALAGGVDAVQLREKGMDDGRFLERARQVREWTREAGALFIVNDRPDIAAISDAEGVHVGQEDFSCRDARRIVGGERLVGVSTHSIEQARQAMLDGADYIGVGPVFPSETKQFSQLAGIEFVRQVSKETSLPAFAIGGIDEANLADVMAAGGSRVAVSRTVCCASDIRIAAQALSSMLKVPR